MTDKQKLREEIIETTKKVRDTGLIYGKEGFDYLLEVLEEYTDYNDCYNAGAKNGMETVWELVKKLCDMNCKETKNIFGVSEGLYDITRNFTPQEALAKLKAYEEAQKKIEVGDVVRCNGFSLEYVVMATSDETFSEQPFLRCTEPPYKVAYGSDKDLIKTGKHINILELIGE